MILDGAQLIQRQFVDLGLVIPCVADLGHCREDGEAEEDGESEKDNCV